MSRLKFPSRFAKAQIKFTVENGQRIHLFDTTTQFIYKVGFNVGEIEQYGLPTILQHYYPDIPFQPYETDVKYPVSKLYSLDNYIEKTYTIEEKTYQPSKYVENLLFSLRTLGAPAVDQVDEFGANFYEDDEKQLDNGNYTFLIDQIVYDAQLKDTVFMKNSTYVINVKSDAVSNTVGQNHPVYDPVGVTIDRNSFVPYAQQKTIANNIMKDKMWIKRFADKHYLIIFKPNNVNLNPRILFGVPISTFRVHPNDDTRY